MISSPDLAETRSRLADWLELRALFSEHGAGDADLRSIARLTSDDHRDREVDEVGDIVEEEILDQGVEDTLSRVAEEIAHREASYGVDYPFNIAKPFHVELKPMNELSEANWTYLFLLLLSGQRDKALPSSPRLDALIRSGRVLFHVCASIGVAGLLRNGRTVWFGFPRPDGTSFLNALTSVCEKLGFGKAKTAVPPGLPVQAQDDGIDVIGWRPYRDGRPGGLLVLCQAATGDNWDGKSVLPMVGTFRSWFDREPYSKATGSIALPFPAHHEVIEDVTAGFDAAVHGALHRTQNKHGVIIDRCRIVEAVPDILQDQHREHVGGIEKLPELERWVRDAISAVKDAA